MTSALQVKRRVRAAKIAFASIALACAAAVNATTITGEELPGSDSFAAPSTNALNYDQQTPGHVGQIAPYVSFVSDGPGQVTLSFNNGADGIEYFEYRIDGISLTSGDPHQIVLGDYEYPGVLVHSGETGITRTFTANDYVEVRLALGAENDWYFDWTAFDVGAARVPEPAVPALLAMGLIGLGVTTRRRMR